MSFYFIALEPRHLAQYFMHRNLGVQLSTALFDQSSMYIEKFVVEPNKRLHAIESLFLCNTFNTHI